MSADEVPWSWRLRSFWRKFPRTLPVVLTLLLAPTLVRELVVAWNWHALQASQLRLERWGGGGETHSGIAFSVSLQPRLWARWVGARPRVRDFLEDWCPWLIDTPHVTSIQVVGSQFDDAAMEFAVREFPEVVQLDLDGCHLSRAGLHRLRSWKGLRALRLERISLSGDSLEELAGIPLLQSLEIRDCPCPADTELRMFPPLSQLKVLHLETSGLETGGLPGLTELPALTQLRLYADQLTDESLRALPPLPALRFLSIRSSQVTGRCLAHLGQLPALTILEIDGSPIDDAGLDCLPANNRLRGLFLVGSRVTGPGLTSLARLSALDDLSLAQAPLTDEGLACLTRLPKLRALNLSETAITAKSFTLLRQQCPKLKTLLVSLSETLTQDDITSWQERGESRWRFNTAWKPAHERAR